MCAPKIPKPPSAQSTSAAQTGTNVSTAIANAYLGNINENTPDGSTTVDKTGTESTFDPFTNTTYQIPRFTRNTTLSPAQQAIKTQQDQTSLGLNTLANKQTNFLQGYMDKPFTFNDQSHTKWASDQYHKLNDQQFADEQQQAQSKLSNMGIKMGTPAYDREISRLEQSQGHQRDQFLLDSYGQDFATQQALRNQPINEITALESGGQVSQPNFMGANMPTIPTTDNAGIINQNYAQRVAAANAAGANTGAIFSGIGSAIGALPWSDKRLKKDIHKVGNMNGQEIFKYRMKSGGPMRMGLIAQKVEKKTPEAVVTMPSGMKKVNYGIALGRKAA